MYIRTSKASSPSQLEQPLFLAAHLGQTPNLHVFKGETCFPDTTADLHSQAKTWKHPNSRVRAQLSLYMANTDLSQDCLPPSSSSQNTSILLMHTGFDCSDRKHQKTKQKSKILWGKRSTGSLVAPEALCNLHLSVSSPTSFSHTTGIPFEPEEPTERAVPCFLLPQFLESLLRLPTSLPAGGLEETKPPTRPGCFICTELQPAARASGLLWKCSHPTLLPDTLRPTVSSTHLTECLLS